MDSSAACALAASGASALPTAKVVSSTWAAVMVMDTFMPPTSISRVWVDGLSGNMTLNGASLLL